MDRVDVAAAFESVASKWPTLGTSQTLVELCRLQHEELKRGRKYITYTMPIGGVVDDAAAVDAVLALWPDGGE